MPPCNRVPFRNLTGVAARSKHALGRRWAAAHAIHLFGWCCLVFIRVVAQVDENSFDLLRMSYETSPYEAWIALRRVTVAVPVILSAPETLRERILAEFQYLVQKRFIEMPVRAYLNAPPAVRSLLQASIDQLGAKEKEAFAAALKKLS